MIRGSNPIYSRHEGGRVDTVPVGGIRLGVVVDVHPSNKTCTVTLSPNESYGLITNVPWISGMAGIGTGAGAHFIPQRGYLCLVASIPNFYHVILGFVNESTPTKFFDEIYKSTLYEPSFPDAPLRSGVDERFSTGRNNPYYGSDQNPYEVNRSGGSPRELHMGDSEIDGTAGEKIGIYRGGMIRIFASNVAQTIYFKFRSLIRTISRRWELWTDSGKLEFKTQGDNTFALLKMASSFKDEAMPGKELWRVRQHMGAGEDISALYITDPLEDPEEDPGSDQPPDYGYLSGKELYFNKIKPDGNRDEFSKQSIKRVADIDITDEAVTGNYSLKAGQNITEEAALNRTDKIGVNSTEEVGAAKVVTVGTSYTKTVGAAYSVTATGPSTITSQSSAAMSGTAGVSIFSGGPVLIAGLPVVISPTGSVPGPVVSGGPGLTGAMSFLAIFNTHTHIAPSGGGPTSSPAPLITTNNLTKTSVG